MPVSRITRLTRLLARGTGFLVCTAIGLCTGWEGAAAAGRTPDGAEWTMDGRTSDAQRYSPLDQINEHNVARLGLAWSFELNTFRGVEATPLVIDGVLYDISAWDITTAMDARTGKVLWTYDPKVPTEWGRYACCEPVSRGLAWYEGRPAQGRPAQGRPAQGRAIIATLDGRLIALDAKTGTPVWTVQTFDKSAPYSITGAPRVFDGKIIVGNGGSDFGARGFVAAYDAATGAFLWKFYLVPGDPALGFENASMEAAAKTWNGNWWQLGGGGGAWDSFSYDPKLKMIFIGTGNGTPLSQHFRSPAGGDNLFLCSIVALDAETGSYRWHYQEVPGEEWDYDCTQSIVLADLKINGRKRPVLMQAPKDGFFYVIDRRTGELLSANNYVPVNWASRIDIASGKPVINEAARYGLDPVLVTPGPGGGHNWFPMSFSPKTGLAYFPAFEQWFVYARSAEFAPKKFRSNSGFGGFAGAALEKRIALQKEGDTHENAFLVAWDPVRQSAVWKVPLPRHGNGGVLTTAGNLVVEGTTQQTLSIFRATDGKTLWEMPVQSAPVAGPMTFEVDGEQFIAVNAGWGGGAAQVERSSGTAQNRASARLLVFKLGGTATLPPLADAPPIPQPPPLTADEDTVQRGARLFADTCAVCHGQMAQGGVKDLRRMDKATHADFNDIVLEGKRADKGMASFASLLSLADVEAIHAYVISRANEDWGHTNEHE